MQMTKTGRRTFCETQSVEGSVVNKNPDYILACREALYLWEVYAPVGVAWVGR